MFAFNKQTNPLSLADQIFCHLILNGGELVFRFVFFLCLVDMNIEDIVGVEDWTKNGQTINEEYEVH